MQESSQNPSCPTCQAPIPADAPGGLCPSCALQGAAASKSSQSGRLSPPPPIEQIAPHFPDLEIIELLGYGAMGAVYKARQPQLDRMVAIKILSHELAKEPAFVERFDREAKMLARLSHPNIVAIHDFGTAGPYCYLKMEHVDGVNLRQAMETGGFKPAEALALVQDVCAALQFAHEEGILHRDIKPENVLIDSKGRVKIADFGIAKMIGVSSPMDVTLTMQGSILGTPHYMAPEQIETPSDVDQRADIYSLGVVLYEMLTGELPIGRFALPSEKAAMDARIDEIVLRTLAKEREARYQTAGEVGTQVAHLTANPQAPSAPPAPPVPPAPPESGRARFSIASPILTGVSLILIFAFLFFWVTLVKSVPVESFEQEQVPLSTAQEMSMTISGGLFFAIVLIAPGLLTGVLGFVLGAVAIGDVRKSGGRKSGLGLAMFAVLAWPFLITWALHDAFRMASSPMDGSASVGMVIYTILYFVTLLLAAFFMIRGLWRWVSGVETEDGQKRFPAIWSTLPIVAALLCFGPVLGYVMRSAGAFGEQGHEDYLDQGPALGELVPKDSSTHRSPSTIFTNAVKIQGRGDIEWYHEYGPDQVWSFELAKGLVLEGAQLVPQSSMEWSVEGELEDLTIDPSTDLSRRRFQIELGAISMRGTEAEGYVEIREKGGFAVRNTNSTKFLELSGLRSPDLWKFENLEASRSRIEEPGTHEILFASHPSYPTFHLVLTVREK